MPVLPLQLGENLLAQAHQALRAGAAPGDRFFADIHHAGIAGFVEVGKRFRHGFINFLFWGQCGLRPHCPHIILVGYGTK